MERRATLGSTEVQARAFAGFVRTPPEVDINAVTRATGLGLNLPDAGECVALSGAGREPTVALSSLRRVELLAVGKVSLETPDGRVELAPRAFPAVTDLVAGVVYTTRDRAAALPPGEAYAITTTGNSDGLALNVSTEAPPTLEGLTLAGTTLTAQSSLSAAGAEMGWKPGASRDLVYVTIADPATSLGVACTFRDEAGRGSLPASAVPAGDNATLSVHRLRTVALGMGSGLDAGELRFDFEVATTVSISDR